MLKELVQPFVEQFSYLNLFQYITFRTAYGSVTAFLIAIIIMPFVIKLQLKRRLGENIREDGPKTHLSKKGTPTMGGIVICLAIAVAVLLWMDILSYYTWAVLLLLFGFGTLGFIDDYLKLTQKEKKGLRSWTKLLGQILIGSGTAFILMVFGSEQTTRVYFPFVKNAYVDLGWMYAVFVVLIVISTTNAVNLTDGLDGLASGLVIIMAGGFTLISYVTGRVDFAAYLQIPFVANAGELAILSFAIVGACIGFLWYNSPPSQIMMGDTGSLTLGALVSAIAIITKHELLLIIMGGVFVIETLSVIVQVFSYKVFKRRVFKMSPIHHHFEMCGWKESKIVIRFWIAGGFFLILALSTLKIR